jgi:hypothetical protein
MAPMPGRGLAGESSARVSFSPLCVSEQYRTRLASALAYPSSHQRLFRCDLKRRGGGRHRQARGLNDLGPDEVSGMGWVLHSHGVDLSSGSGSLNTCQTRGQGDSADSDEGSGLGSFAEFSVPEPVPGMVVMGRETSVKGTPPLASCANAGELDFSAISSLSGLESTAFRKGATSVTIAYDRRSRVPRSKRPKPLRRLV